MASELTPTEIATLDWLPRRPAPLADRVRSLRLWSRGRPGHLQPQRRAHRAGLPGRGQPGAGLAGRGDGRRWTTSPARRTPGSAPAGTASSRCTSPSASAAATASSRWPSSTCRPAEIDQQVGEARLTTWLLVTLAIVVSAVLLYGIVKRGSDTIAAPGGGPHPAGGRADGAARGERRPQRARQLGGAAHHDAQRARHAPGQRRPARRPRADALAGHPAPGRAAHARRGRPAGHGAASWPRSRRRSRRP